MKPTWTVGVRLLCVGSEPVADECCNFAAVSLAPCSLAGLLAIGVFVVVARAGIVAAEGLHEPLRISMVRVRGVHGRVYTAYSS